MRSYLPESILYQKFSASKRTSKRLCWRWSRMVDASRSKGPTSFGNVARHESYVAKFVFCPTNEEISPLTTIPIFWFFATFANCKSISIIFFVCLCSCLPLRIIFRLRICLTDEDVNLFLCDSTLAISGNFLFILVLSTTIQNFYTLMWKMSVWHSSS